MSELGTGVARGEMPVDLPLVAVGGVLPGGEFSVENVQVSDAAVKALAGQGGQLDFCDGQPRSVSGGVWWISSRCASANALAGSKASYSEPMVCVLRLSITKTTFAASG